MNSCLDFVDSSWASKCFTTHQVTTHTVTEDYWWHNSDNFITFIVKTALRLRTHRGKVARAPLFPSPSILRSLYYNGPKQHVGNYSKNYFLLFFNTKKTRLIYPTLSTKILATFQISVRSIIALCLSFSFYFFSLNESSSNAWL